MERHGFADRITSKKGSWLTLIIGLVVMGVLFGVFGSAKAPEASEQAPPESESQRAQALLDEFPGADEQSVLIVATARDGGEITDRQTKALKDLAGTLNETTASNDGEASDPILSEDGEAAVLLVPITTGESNTANAEVIGDLRSTVAEHGPTDLKLEVTGGPAFGADVAAAFDGADFTLLAVTIAIVAVLLIVTYRSPILWLVPLIAVGLADGLAGRLTAAAGQAWNLQFDAGIISVLVFGAGTNYALLLISRYREELLRHTDHRAALAVAWKHTVGAILASNLTVVLSLLTLVLAVIPGTHGLGITSAIGLLTALAGVLLLLPPMLAIVGRGAFWPSIPRCGTKGRRDGVWRRVATAVVRRPLVSAGAGIALLAIMASGLFGVKVGLDQLDRFRVQSESAAGLETLSQHFPPGEAQPILIVANEDKADDVVAAVEDRDGIVRAGEIDTHNGLSKIMVTSDYSPSTDESLAQIDELREAVGAVDGADALVGGQVAADVDARAGNAQDFALIVPLILGVTLVVLFFVARSALAPFVLLAINAASALAAIGAGWVLSRVVLGSEALDLQVPLLSFLFLVALGIDYTIFLVHRARREAAEHGTAKGMVEAVTHTGGVITSAGIVLAAVFAALGVLPLVTLGQLGLIVGIGVLIDTLLVRTVIVPAVFTLIGDKIWWPSKPHSQAAEVEAAA
ncbi:hypothetical protein HMPREF3172_04090 [Brevibacterium sp. HMSC08F02]|uniref:MMPL family transporter n=1 Tax=Brevibacterium sp. HMSC08F02 TaxID=1581140 RepID=UPI0008A4925A|nr:MMPL family transporter [Brevibacterium sp. HMSC08F02]OFT26341.1 hypothetical protein HMPREF3172_04090 [Brevibacterium sp. HMSC08F02]